MELWSKCIIGLELDSKEIRAVELKGSKKKYSVTAWGKVSLPEGTVKDGKIQNADQFSASIEKLLTENGFKGRDIIFGVNNQDIIVRFASFPKVPEDKIRNMIQFQARDYIPIPIEELELDYVIVGEKSNEEGEFINVVLVGARKKMLHDFINAFAKANTSIMEIDSVMFALGRAALIASEDGTFALAGFNHDIGNVLLFKNGVLGMARSVLINQSQAWITSGESERQNTEHETDIIADILLGEIKTSVSYYKMQSNEDIDKIYVLGNGANQKEIASRLAETTGLSVVVPNPYEYMENLAAKRSSGFKASEYVACISLAMRGLGE